VGLFDFFNSEYSQYKKIYNHVNNLTVTDDRYRRASQALCGFFQGSLMMPRIIDKKLFQKKEKMNVFIPYFSGATSLVGRAVKLNDDEIDVFVIFFLVLWLCDGDYKRMKEMGNEYLSVGFSKEKEVLWEKGSKDANDMLNEAEEPSKLFLRLNKLL
jgi:hypothetical protein